MNPRSKSSTLNRLLGEKAIKVKPKIAFSWFKQPSVINANDGIKAVRVAMSVLSNTKQDIPTARLILKQVRDALATTVQDIDNILEPVEGSDD